MPAKVICLKDADGLDRVRLNDLNPSFIRTSYARALVSVAQRLFNKTNKSNSMNVWTSVRASALQMGVWR